MKICQNCHKGYEAKRSTSKYCSDACRKLAFQQVSVLRDAKISVPSEKEVSVKNDKQASPIQIDKQEGKFVNHITGEIHDITEKSTRTWLSYDLNERSEHLGLKKYRCSGCGEPTWFGCAECGKDGGQK